MAPANEGERARTRRWPRRLLIGLNIFVALCVLLTGAAYAYVRFQWGKVPEIALAEGILGETPESTEEAPGRVMNVLLVGSDSRAAISEEDRQRFDDRRNPVAGQRSDTIMVLHIDPSETKAAILSIPRDLYVPLAGTSTRSGKPRMGRINQAFDGEDGPANLIRTIESFLGIDIDHMVQVDFNGFRGIVDTIGGVTTYFPSPARDLVSGLYVPEAGCVKLDGEGALAYVRSRHYEYMENGRWRDEGGIPDFNRIDRQQKFLRRIMAKAISKAKNPLTANRLINKTVKFIAKDPELDIKDVTKIGLRFRSLDPSRVDMFTLPTTPVRRGGMDVLELKQPDAGEVLRQFKDLPDPAPGVVVDVLPSSVQVRVLNGSGVTGQASQVTDALRQYDFQVGQPGNADQRYTQNVIVYGTGQKDKALLLQSALVGGARLEPDTSLRGTDLVLITGSEFDGVQAPTAASGTTTTGPAATTTTVAGEEVPEQPKC